MSAPSLSNAPQPKHWIARWADSDVWYSFKKSKVTVVAAIVAFWIFCLAFFAPFVAPHNPFDVATINLLDASRPPVWMPDGDPRFLLGTDNQGRDVLSSIMYGMRISLMVGFLAVAFAASIGITLGLIAGYFGGKADTIIMRMADVQLTFPAILVALLIAGVASSAVGGLAKSEQQALFIIVISIGLSFWVQYARTVRGQMLVEKNKDYVMSAKLIGLGSGTIMFKHILPNVLGPVLVIATINLALAIILEATLSFLGVGMPATQPSVGTLIRVGSQFQFSGEWWMVTFPGLTLALFVISMNLLGDWLRDALNPKLR